MTREEILNKPVTPDEMIAYEAVRQLIREKNKTTVITKSLMEDWCKSCNIFYTRYEEISLRQTLNEYR